MSGTAAKSVFLMHAYLLSRISSVRIPAINYYA